MPTININKEIVEELIGKKLPIEKFKDRISMLGTDLESIEGNSITLEIFPNRPDMLSEQGFARAFSSFIGVKTGLRDYAVKSSGYKVMVDKSVSKVRPFTVCAIVKNIGFTDEKIREIIQIQEKLHVSYCRNRKKAAIGIYPLEQIKLPIHYTAKKPADIKFQPLESNKVMSGSQILSQHPTGRDYGHLLEGCSVYPVFIDANDEILSMPPIINSHKTGKVTENTRNVFIECSGFDLNHLKTLLNIIVTAMADMGGQIYSMEVQYPDMKITTPDLKHSTMKLDLPYINSLLGIELKIEQASMLLERMGYGYSSGKVSVPSYRADVLHQIDLAEDIAIAYGYENFKEEIPKVATIASESKKERLISKIASILTGFGLIETSTFHLSNEQELNVMMNLELDMVKIANSATKEYSALRNWMIPSLMRVLKDNLHHEYPQNIFEIATIFQPEQKEETKVKEIKRLSVLLCSPEVDYTKIKQVLDALMRALGLSYSTLDAEHPSFIPGRVGRIVVDGIKLAYIGEIHPSVLSNWNLENPVAALELNIDEIYKILNK